MPLSEEAFQRQVLSELAAIKANQSKDEKSFDIYRGKVDELLNIQSRNTQSLKDAHCRIDELRHNLQNTEIQTKNDIAKEISSIYRTAAIVGATVSFIISLLLQKVG